MLLGAANPPRDHTALLFAHAAPAPPSGQRSLPFSLLGLIIGLLEPCSGPVIRLFCACS